MRAQRKLIFQIGTPSQEHSMEQDIIREASRLCGGCTVSNKVGYFRETDDMHQAEFDGPLIKENCFELELTCESDKFTIVYHEMVLAICAAAHKYGVDTNWVHVTEYYMTGLHFSIEEMTARWPKSENAMRMKMDPPSAKPIMIGEINEKIS